MESLEDIESKLNLYQSQLEQVNQLLESDAENSQFISLKDDLEKVISLTETLYQQYYPTTTTTKQTQQPSQSTTHSSVNIRKRGREGQPEEDNEEYNLSDLEGNAAGGGEEEDNDDNEEEEVEVEDEITKGTAPTLLPPKTTPLQVNDHIEVIGGDRPYAGIVTEIIHTKEFKIKYYEYTDTEVSLPLTSLQRISPGPYVLQYDQIHNHHLTIGFKCQSKYSADQQYYDCIITEITKNGYLVTYTGYGNSEEVPLEYLRPPVLILQKDPSLLLLEGGNGVMSGDGGGAGDGKNGEGGKGSNGFSGGGNNNNNNKNTKGNQEASNKKSQIIPIPNNLKILPTDTEEEKQRKKKKIKAIKNKNRIISQEEESSHVQQSWKKFVDKGAKKAITGIVKSSLFASSDANQSKVGVTNSGKGMTQYGERKKYKFDLDG